MPHSNPWKKHGLRRHMILVENPVVQSYASQILLREKLLREALASGDEYLRHVWFPFRKDFLKRQKQLNGVLTCFYCGKKNLSLISATIDHWIPISKGGKIFDEMNLRISCHSCNEKKGNLLPEEFTCL